MKKNVRLAQRGPPAARGRCDYLFQRWRISEKSRLRARIPRNQNNARIVKCVESRSILNLIEQHLCRGLTQFVAVLILTLCLSGWNSITQTFGEHQQNKNNFFPDSSFFDKIIATKIELINLETSTGEVSSGRLRLSL
jgi:hypothetical protein